MQLQNIHFSQHIYEQSHDRVHSYPLKPSIITWQLEHLRLIGGYWDNLGIVSIGIEGQGGISTSDGQKTTFELGDWFPQLRNPILGPI